jgi:hypothetical protein
MPHALFTPALPVSQQSEEYGEHPMKWRLPERFYPGMSSRIEIPLRKIAAAGLQLEN